MLLFSLKKSCYIEKRKTKKYKGIKRDGIICSGNAAFEQFPSTRGTTDFYGSRIGAEFAKLHRQTGKHDAAWLCAQLTCIENSP